MQSSKEPRKRPREDGQIYEAPAKADQDDAEPRTISTAEAEGLTPRQFWLEYVSQRKPVHIDGHLQQREWKATRKWTNEYLARAGVMSSAC